MIGACAFGICMSIAGLVCLSLGILNTQTQLWVPGLVFVLAGMVIVVTVLRYSYNTQVTEQINPVMKKNKSDTNLELMDMDTTEEPVTESSNP
jgi:threonine/homoserine efflux transporter RhtA